MARPPNEKAAPARHSNSPAASEAVCAVRELDWSFGVDPIRICIYRSNHYLHAFEAKIAASSPILGDLFAEILMRDHSKKITRTED
jgi:hypothetical protein